MLHVSLFTDAIIIRRAGVMLLKTPFQKLYNVTHMNNPVKNREIIRGNENKWSGLALTTLLAETNINAGVRLMYPPLGRLGFRSGNQLPDRSVALLDCRSDLITAN